MARFCDVYYREPEDPFRAAHRREQEEREKPPEQRTAERMARLADLQREIERLERSLMVARDEHKRLQAQRL